VLLNHSQTRDTEHLTNMWYWTPHKHVILNISQTCATEHLTNTCYLTHHKHVLLNKSRTCNTEHLRNTCSGKTQENYSLPLSMCYVITAVGPPLNSGISVDLKVTLMHFGNRRCRRILFHTSREKKCVLLSRKYGILHLKSICMTS
jgi:hypothetical protein